MNYMNQKSEELYAKIEQFGLDKATYETTPEGGKTTLNRKKLADTLTKIDNIMAGKIAEVMVIDDESGEVTTHNPRKKLKEKLSGMMVQITFYNSSETDLPHVQLALNGLALLVPREVESWIPKEFIDGVLVPAVITKMKMDVTRDGKIRYIPKKVPRLSYTVKDIKHIDELRKEFTEAKNKK